MRHSQERESVRVRRDSYVVEIMGGGCVGGRV
jgi:hypothetical protein